jgi:shikimate kinase
LAGIKEDMKVILIGYRATGKSTVGTLLSAKLKIPFGDTDTLVEEKMEMPIKKIVALHGWDFFRNKEKEAVLMLTQEGACVIATGGGVVLDKENVDLLSQAGVIIWLNTPLHDIISRLNNNTPGAALRPQFTDWNIVQETIHLVKQRFPLYENAANHTVETANKSPLQVAEEIYQYLVESGNLIKIIKSKK